jgi:hypothetical protein
MSQYIEPSNNEIYHPEGAEKKLSQVIPNVQSRYLENLVTRLHENIEPEEKFVFFWLGFPIPRVLFLRFLTK